MVRTIRIITSIFILFLSSACSQNRQAENTITEKFPEEIISACGEAIYPSAYHLFEIGPNSNDGLPEGMSVFSFREFLSDTDKDHIKIKLNELHQEASESKRDLMIKKTGQWCRFYFHIDQIQNQLSTEEILAGLYDSPGYDFLFSQYSERAMFKLQDAASIDRVSTLSSTESSDIINRWITFASELSPENFEKELENSRKIVAN